MKVAHDPAKLLEKYLILKDFSINEERAISERARNYLTTTAILFTAYGLALQIAFLRYAIPIIGILYNFFWYYLGKRNALAFYYWRREMHLIEEEFQKIGQGYEVYNIFSNRDRYYAGEPVATLSSDLVESRGESVRTDKIHQYIPGDGSRRPQVRLYAGQGIERQFPWRFLGNSLNFQMIYTPAFFLVAWAVVLGMSIFFPHFFLSGRVR